MPLIAEKDENQLTPNQESRLLALNASLRDDFVLLMQVAEIKTALARDDLWAALERWNELEAWEQEKIWVAPKFGGLFTTLERSRLRERA